MVDLLLAAAAGYVACIIFPMPIVSQWVLNKWGQLRKAIVG